jgi:hypothetical protein
MKNQQAKTRAGDHKRGVRNANEGSTATYKRATRTTSEDVKRGTERETRGEE